MLKVCSSGKEKHNDIIWDSDIGKNGAFQNYLSYPGCTLLFVLFNQIKFPMVCLSQLLMFFQDPLQLLFVLPNYISHGLPMNFIGFFQDSQQFLLSHYISHGLPIKITCFFQDPLQFLFQNYIFHGLPIKISCLAQLHLLFCFTKLHFSLSVKLCQNPK